MAQLGDLESDEASDEARSSHHVHCQKGELAASLALTLRCRGHGVTAKVLVAVTFYLFSVPSGVSRSRTALSIPIDPPIADRDPTSSAHASLP